MRDTGGLSCLHLIKPEMGDNRRYLHFKISREMRTENRKLVIRRFCLTFCYSQRSKHSKDMKDKNQIEKGEK